MKTQERDRLIDLYAKGPAELLAAWNETPKEMRTWRPAEGEWSAHEIVVHCADSETYAAIRIRLLAAEPSPLIVGYDQERWAVSFNYHRLPADSALGVIKSVRELTTQVIRALSDEQWDVIGTHTESGRYGALDWLRIYADHLHDHARQIRSNIASWNARDDAS